MKQCNKCHLEKPIKELYTQAKGKFGVSGRCKECMRTYFNNRYKTNPTEIKAIQERYHKKNPLGRERSRLKYEYNITLEEYDILIIKCGNKCQICNESKLKLHLDHCHTTNKIRGLLCPKCNKALGLFKDDIDILQKAINYLTDAHIE